MNEEVSRDMDGFHHVDCPRYATGLPRKHGGTVASL